jgi:predicted MFS family arabinose efflux permease
MPTREASQVSEREVVFLVGLSQFVNILDFMIVLPLGPDYARELGIATSNLGVVGGSYTAAAAVAGIAAARFLDRFDRRLALAVSMLGLVLSTVAAGAATSLVTMLGARILAGAFGGPATAIGLSVVADLVPVERRGKALGAVMGAFAIASVVGVPAGLELGRRFGWRFPLYAVAALGFAVVVGVIARLPPLRGHLTASRIVVGPLALLRKPGTLAAVAGTVSISLAGFSIIPNVSAYLQANCGFPREQLGLLYLAGGLPTFFVLRLAGRLADVYGSSRVALAGSLLFVLAVVLGFATGRSLVHPALVFMLMMSAQSTRNVSSQTLGSRVPLPHERAGFQSLQSAVQHMGAALGSALGSVFLTTAPNGELLGMPALSAFAVVAALPLPWTLRSLERVVAGASRAEGPSVPRAA